MGERKLSVGGSFRGDGLTTAASQRHVGVDEDMLPRSVRKAGERLGDETMPVAAGSRQARSTQPARVPRHRLPTCRGRSGALAATSRPLEP
jgi:hypothetical protein